MAEIKIQPNNTKDLHLSALHAILQAAANVELFTIPLYMCSMYSLVGSRQISGNNALYRGRWWPGAEATRFPNLRKYDDVNRLPLDDSLFSATNNDIYNKMLKIFIEEMLHLQLVANLAKLLGVKNLSFTSAELMDSVGSNGKHPGYNWHCYNNTRTIPHIVDLTDTEHFKDIVVRLDALNKNQIQLFKAIESPEDVLKKELEHAPAGKYFPGVPFDNWTKDSTLADLPMFGSIGHMYECLWQYINMEFEDGSILLDYIGKQQDFGNFPRNRDRYIYPIKDKEGKPTGEVLHQYPFNTTFDDVVPDTQPHQYDRAVLLGKIMDMINAITDQGEGKDVAEKIDQRKADPDLDMAVSEKAQGDFKAMSRQYKSYDDQGNLMPYSEKAEARAGKENTGLDHEELFGEIEKLMKKADFKTWDMWHAEGNNWRADMLQSSDYVNNANADILPTPQAVADAMNRLKNGADRDENFRKMTQVASGAIKGITTVLNEYWNDDAKSVFPNPSMHGSGGRVAMCWAVFGKCPDIAGQALEERNPNIINHACQGLSFDLEHSDTACANFALAHTCTGSNTCRAEGGCGFLHPVADEDNTFDPPGDNSCKGHGGCAVPISASQLFPKPNKDGAKLNVYDFEQKGEGDFEAVKFSSIHYKDGDAVYDIAWQAYEKVMRNLGQEPREKPQVSDIRLVYPPST